MAVNEKANNGVEETQVTLVETDTKGIYRIELHADKQTRRSVFAKLKGLLVKELPENQYEIVESLIDDTNPNR